MVECGALLGYSTLQMADEATRVISIDKHEGYGPSTLRPYMSNIQGRLDKVVPVVGDFRDVLRGVEGERYFIDLDGTEETTREVLGMICVSTPVALHDFGRQSCRGVERAIQQSGWRISGVVDTLAFVEKE